MLPGLKCEPGLFTRDLLRVGSEQAVAVRRCTTQIEPTQTVGTVGNVDAATEAQGAGGVQVTTEVLFREEGVPQTDELVFGSAGPGHNASGDAQRHEDSVRCQSRVDTSPRQTCEKKGRV